MVYGLLFPIPQSWETGLWRGEHTGTKQEARCKPEMRPQHNLTYRALKAAPPWGEGDGQGFAIPVTLCGLCHHNRPSYITRCCGTPQSWACWKKRRRRRRSLPLQLWPPMDTKMQSLSSTHPPRSQGHTCNQCSCSHHCRNCSQAGHQSSSSSPSPSPKQTMHSRHSPKYRGCCSKNRKTLEGKVNKRKAVRRRKRTYRTKTRSSGTCPVE